MIVCVEDTALFEGFSSILRTTTDRGLTDTQVDELFAHYDRNMFDAIRMYRTVSRELTEGSTRPSTAMVVDEMLARRYRPERLLS